MKPFATTNPIVIIAVDLVAIAINGPKYLALATVLWFAKRSYRSRVKSWN